MEYNYSTQGKRYTLEISGDREKGFEAMLDFIKEAKKNIPDVEATIVDLPNVNKKACEKIAKDLGAKFRVRPYYEEKYVR